MTTPPDSGFPRSKTLPKQSPLFWVKDKDRYLRQLLLGDIQEQTGRDLVVYYTDCDTSAQIDGNDDKYLIEMLGGCATGKVDLLLETNGGFTDPTEKLVSILQQRAPDLRVIVPKRAKSNGTLIALVASKIVMGCASELGPIDPNLNVSGGPIPAHFLLSAPSDKIDPIIRLAAEHVVKQTQKLAMTLLAAGMLKSKNSNEVDGVVQQLSTRDVYYSHGSVIDHREAIQMGLAVEYLPPEDELWQRLWLLRCMYEHDARRENVVKIFEGYRYSSMIRQSVVPNKP